MYIAYLLSAAAFLSGVGLNVTSGWLITMASFMPPVLTLNVAVVMVRFLEYQDRWQDIANGSLATKWSLQN